MNVSFIMVSKWWIYKTEEYYDKNPYTEYHKYINEQTIKYGENIIPELKKKHVYLYNKPSMGCYKGINQYYIYKIPIVKDDLYHIYKYNLDDKHFKEIYNVINEFSIIEDLEIVYFIVKNDKLIQIIYKNNADIQCVIIKN